MGAGSGLLKLFCRLSAVLIIAGSARADGLGDVRTAIGGTRPIVEGRLRFENVDQRAAPNEAEALTMRARLGFETGKAWETSLLVEGDVVWSLIERYDSTTNGNTGYPIVADPRGNEINRLQLTNAIIPATTITLGRQLIALDDQRFVGNSAWRQNEQTFDSVRVVNRSVPNLTVDLAYIDQVNRVFGKESVQGRYDGDNVLANVSYKLPAGTLSVFDYRLRFEPIAEAPQAVRDSSTTLGTRFAGEWPARGAKIAYAASYATQRETGATPLSFDLEYYLAEISGTYRSYSLGTGIEVLGGDGARGFSTPLATLHKFQGWADKFLVTPVDGIEDRYVNAGFTLQRTGPLDALSALASLHWYDAERISRDYGSEIDLQLQARWRRLTGIVKYADYHADRLFADTTKFWIQLEYVW